MTPDVLTVVLLAAAVAGAVWFDRQVQARLRVRAIMAAGIPVSLSAVPAARVPAAAAAFGPGRPPIPTDFAALAEVQAAVCTDLAATLGDLLTFAEGLSLDAWKVPPRVAADEIQKAIDALADMNLDLLKWSSGEVPIRSTFDLTGVCVGGMVIQRTPEGSTVLFPDEELATAMSTGLQAAMNAAAVAGRPIVAKSTVAFGLASAPD